MTKIKLPKEFVPQPIEYRTYLIDGQLKEWDGPQQEVYSTISSTEDYQPTYLGS